MRTVTGITTSSGWQPLQNRMNCSGWSRPWIGTDEFEFTPCSLCQFRRLIHRHFVVQNIRDEFLVESVVERRLMFCAV